MRSSSPFSFLAAAVLRLSSSTATASAQSPLPLPQFAAILTGQFTGFNENQTQGPFGTRAHIEASGGDLLNATTGEVVGTVLSFSANGVTTTSGLSFPSGVMPLTWSADGHFASVFLNGRLIMDSDAPWANRNESETALPVWQYAHVETDSPTFSWMNGKLFLMQLDPIDVPVRGFTIYEETNSGVPASSSIAS